MFELVLMEMVGEKLTSSPLQFGFKANSSCSRAIFTLRMLVKQFSSVQAAHLPYVHSIFLKRLTELMCMGY